MSLKNYGGQAYPTPGANAREAIPGMTLRDWFAGQALSSIAERCIDPDKTIAGNQAEDIAKACYELADAMIKEQV